MNSVLEKESTKPSADGDNNHRGEGGQGENGSVKIANVPVTKLEGLLQALYDENSDRFLELSVAEIRRELEKRLNLEPRTLKKAEGLLSLIDRFDRDITKKEKSKENKEKERLRKEREKEKEREKIKSNQSDRDRKTSHKSSHKSKRRRDSDSWESDHPTKKPKRYSSSSESYDSDRKRRKTKKRIRMIL